MSGETGVTGERAKLAIDGGVAVRRKAFAAWPIYDDKEEIGLIEAVRSGKWGGHGVARSGSRLSKLQELEKQFAQLQHAKYAVPVVNGTMAITAAFHALGIRAGDEVIMPPYTFIATATAALIGGIIPVFADVEEDTLLLDPDKVEQRITSRTKAIVAVHIGGAPADMTRLKEIADRKGLMLIEDAAQAAGAQWEGRGVGAIGHAGTFSFQSSKNLNAGEGGMLLTNSRETWEEAWSFCNVGRIPEGGWYQHERFGLNLRMTEFQAAILLAQMTRLEDQIRLRESNAKLLDELLSGMNGIRTMRRDPRITRHAWHLYMFRVDLGFSSLKEKHGFVDRLSKEGIPVAPGYIPLNRNKVILEQIRRWTGEARIDECPVCERLCETEAMWLAQPTLLSDEEGMHDIATAIAKVLRSYGRG